MNTLPLVSIIIPAFNAEKYIAAAVDSVLRQSYRNLELIVVDDGSTDRTAAIVRGYGNSVTYLYEENSGGCAKPRNRGIRVAGGQYVSVFDADDVMAPGKIECQVKALLRYPELGAVFTDYVNFGQAGPTHQSHFQTCPQLLSVFRQQGAGRLVILDSKTSCRIMLNENFTSACSPVFPRWALDRVGTYDERLGGSEDFEFHYRLASTYAIGVINEVGYHRRLHPGSMNADVLNILENKIRSRELILRYERQSSHRKSLRRAIGVYQLHVGHHLLGKHNLRSLGRTLQSLRYQHPFNSLFMRNVAKVVLGSAGLIRVGDHAKQAH
jgi:glycosyltransferase involved in cell wall biosynthesis